MTGQELKKLRESNHLTQLDLARRLGVHLMTVSLWERMKESDLPQRNIDKVVNFFKNYEAPTRGTQRFSEWHRGSVIKELRLKFHFTQADMSHFLKVHPVTISNWERTDADLPDEVGLRLCDLYQEFVDNPPPPKPPTMYELRQIRTRAMTFARDHGHNPGHWVRVARQGITYDVCRCSEYISNFEIMAGDDQLICGLEIWVEIQNGQITYCRNVEGIFHGAHHVEIENFADPDAKKVRHWGVEFYPCKAAACAIIAECLKEN